ncbi:chondroitin sulfate proteoglycan 4-like [Lampetra fluviatilis]
MGSQRAARSRGGLLLALAVVTALSQSDPALGASFFGDSYVELLLTEASDQTELSLRFRTHQRNALLFLAAGSSDYCLLELRAGRLQLRMELGSGEGVLRTEPGVRMNDLEWHRVRVQRKGEAVTMTVDGRAPSSARLPGQLQELNIQHGLLLGGIGSLERPYLTGRGGVQSFRGCVEEAVFNRHDILASLRSYAGHKTVHEVSAGCSPEFEANPDDAVSFFSPWSYLAFPPVWGDSGKAVFEFQVRVSVKSGILLYHFRAGKNPPFAALEIREGRLWSLLNVGERTVVMSPKTMVNDSRWHHVHFAFTARHVTLRVDNNTVTESFVVVDTRKFLELRRSGEPLFVGGVDSSTRAEARRNGLVSLRGGSSRGMGGSLRGCLRDLRVDGERRSLQDVQVSKDIAVGCRDGVATAAPTAKLKAPVTPTTKPRRVKGTTRPTAPPTKAPTTTVATTAAATSTTIKPTEPPLLLLHELELPEGGKANLNYKNIRTNVNLQALGNRPSQLFFRVLSGPWHGKIKVSGAVPETESDAPSAGHVVFNLLDVSQERVVYVHDGSEAPGDTFTFELYVTGNRNKMPDVVLNGLKERYVFNITVLPVNDPPELVLPTGNLFTLVEQSRKKLTPDVLQAIDADTDAAELKISVLGNLNAGAGHLESTREPGKVITYFSYADMRAGDVYFVHHGLIRNSRIALRVSDGEKVSNTVVLRLLAIPGEFGVENNTGISVSALEGSALILTANLSVRTNAADQDVEIQYSVTELPKHGEILRLYESNGRWRRAESFTQRAMERKHVSYALSDGANIAAGVTDRFRFKVSVFGKVLEEPQEFAIRVSPAKLKVVNNRSLELDKVERAHLTQKNLQTRVEGAKVSDADIKYDIITLPAKGHLYLGDVKLMANASFTQRDVRSGSVSYLLKERAKSDMEDIVWFHVVAQRLKSKLHSFRFTIKADSEAIEVTNNGLSVVEGEGKLITKNELFLKTLNTQNFRYQIKQSPRHGKLKKINLSDSADSNDNVTTFTNEDIVNKRLMYIHDDSETAEDRFTFSATPTDLNFSSTFNEAFNVTVQLRNDEKPARTVDRVLRVVRNGHKLLTLSDLAYHDADVDSDDAALVYTRRGIPNGELVAEDDPGKKLYQFRQGDLAERRVLFAHRGADQGRFVLWVSDGKHQVTALLEVAASEPYVRVNNGTGLLVRRGHSRAIAAANLSVDTNVDVRDDGDVAFRVTESPMHGRLLLDGHPAESFTRSDLRMGRATYRHDGGRGGLHDRFRFVVELRGHGEGAEMRVEGSLSVRIFLESHEKPPAVVRNASLVVGEEEPVSIGSASLQVTHEVSPPAELVFTVREPPRHGFLRRLVAHGEEEEEEQYEGSLAQQLEAFTQLDVNLNRVQYVHTSPGQLNDSFSLDVGNGVSAPLPALLVAVDVLPRLIPLRLPGGGVLAVREGGSAALLVAADSPHFARRQLEFRVSEPPKHGRVEGVDQPGVALAAFTSRQVERELVYYVHDGSETRDDNFTLVAVDDELHKRSKPTVVPVAVSAVNDEPPVVTTNQVLKVWVGSVTEITSADLRAEDKDTTPEELAYSISPPSNGLVALRERPNQPVLNFTQADVDSGSLVFAHRGATSGGFNFQVTDGVNFAARQIFSITAKPLVLSVEVNNGLSVYPGSLHAITEQDLKVVTNDDKFPSNRSVVYSVIDKPGLGRIVRTGANNNATAAVDSFTQAEVAEGLIAYEHRGGDMGQWSTTDSFVFQASSTPSKLPAQTFHISVSFDNAAGRSGVLLANTGATVVEGQEVAINKSNLDASNLLAKLAKELRGSHEVYLQVTVLPRHGFLWLGSFNVTKEKPYVSQANLDRHGLRYRHDGSEDARDNFTFVAFPNPKNKRAGRPDGSSDAGDSLVVEEVFLIDVLPVNDRAPELKTKTPGLSVVQGFTATISERNLKVVDLDNPAPELKFTIISGPNNGRVAFNDSPSVAVSEFTQADVDAGRVVFVQDGSPASGVFYFRVTDGVHRPLFTLFNLAVEPLSIRLVNHSVVELVQGQATIVVTRGHLAGETNGQSAEITYLVTRGPQAGLLLLNGSRVDTFPQTEIDAGSLAYRMTNMSASEDDFEFSALTAESNVTGLVAKIAVMPLVKIPADLALPAGAATPVNLDMLDARELANLTGHMPHYEVLRPPRHGRLTRRSLRGKRDARGVTRFTQSDVEMGLVLLEVGDVNLTDARQANDSFRFVLRAEGVQPAAGEFAYSIVPLDPSAVPNITSHLEALSEHDSSVTPPVTGGTTAVDSNVATEEAALPFNATVSPYSEAPARRPAPRWRNKISDRWGNRNKNSSADPDDALDPSPSSSSPDLDWAAAESVDEGSGGNLNVIVPVVVAAVALAIIAALALLAIARRRSRDVAKGFRALKPNNLGPSRLLTVGHTERSPTVPTVTVTALGGGGSPSAEADIVAAMVADARANPSPPPSPTALPYTWCHFNADMLQYCRATSPSLRKNQYWV